MDRLKEKPGLVALGVAAAATAGLLIYKVMSGKAASKADPIESEINAEETLESELENNFFLDSAASLTENEKLIVKWMTDQLDSLKGQSDDNKITVLNRRVQKEDFLRIMMIVEGRANVHCQELAQKLETARLALLAEKSLDSLDYVNQVAADVQQMEELREEAKSEVCQLAGIGTFVIDDSLSEFIGDDDHITPSFVRLFLETFLYHSFKNQVFKNAEEAMELYMSVMTKAIDRITKHDTLGIFPSVNDYMLCFNCMCEDIARKEHNMTAADFQHMVDANDLTTKESVQPLFKRISDAILHQLEHGAGDEADAEAERQEVEAQTLQRKKTQTEEIMKYLTMQAEEKKKAAEEKEKKSEPKKEESPKKAAQSSGRNTERSETMAADMGGFGFEANNEEGESAKVVDIE